MGSEKPRETITLGRREISPDKESDYNRRIEAAKTGSPLNKLKDSRPLGHVERPPMPDLKEASEMESELMTAGEQPAMRSTRDKRDRDAETEAGMKHLATAMKNDSGQESAPAKAEKTKPVEPTTEDLLAALEQAAAPRSEAERIFNNKARRELIEGRCSEINFEELLMKGFVQQKIPVIPGKFVATLRSITMEEELFAKKFMVEETGNEAYLTSKYSLCQLACALVAVNENAYVDHLNHQTGDVVEENFKRKLKQLQKMSVYIVADLAVNYAWFDLRCRRLINPEALGNG